MAIRPYSAAALLLFALLHAVFAATPPLVFDDVSIVDAEKAITHPKSRVVIRDGRIAAAGPARTTAIPPGANVIRATGKSLIPGLWDMHVHVGEIEEDWFPLYLANGITGLREMAASPKNVAKLKAYQQQVASGKRIGPELLWTVSPIDAKSGDKPAPLGVSNAAEARAAVRYVQSTGATSVKVYNGLSRDSYFAIAEEARRLKMPMTGHLPDRITAREAANAGQVTIEHLDNILLACSSREQEGRNILTGVAGGSLQRLLLDTFQPSKADELFELFRARGVWQTPTLLVLRASAWARDKRMTEDPHLQYARPDYLKEWRDSLRNARDPVIEARWLRRHQSLIAQMYQNHVPMLAGTDTPNPFAIPGFALHDEMELMVASGIPPAAVLAAATTNPARFLGRNDLGSIAPGKIADLVLLDADPLVQIGNTRKIAGVVRNGNWLDAKKIQEMLESVKRAVTSAKPH